MKHKTLMSWSSGKDSAWALHTLRQDPEIELAGLFCTINRQFDRVAMHGVRVELLKKQAASVGLPLQIIELPFPCSNDDYAAIMTQFVEGAKSDGVECFAFGDLFLEDVRRYREEKLLGTGIKPIFPIWGIDTDVLSREMIDSGLKTVITCIDPRLAPEALVGREFDRQFLDALPDTVDPCGENGEFHSFVFDGPMFKEQLEIAVGDIVRRDGFVFADILSKRSN
jgi:uncharacterized protein (TIGR00290 family)